MPHIVYKDNGTHWLVIADYSGSPRHAALTEAQWIAEYTTHAAYAGMREANPGAVAGIKPKGVGKWTKDWAQPYVDPYTQLRASSNATPDFDGVPAVLANGIAKHFVTVKKVDQNGSDVGSGSEPIRILASFPVPISNASPSLVNGEVMIEVGPMTAVGDVKLDVADPAGVIRKGSLSIRFK